MKHRLLPVLLPFFAIMLFFYHPSKSYAACPLDSDTKMNVDPNNITQCFSNSDPAYNPGFNTTGGARSCGPVQCPGSTAPYTRGNTCVIKKTDGFCYAGKGPSGFDVPGCSTVATHLAGCPQPMDLTIKAVSSADQTKGVGGIVFTVTYEDAPPGNLPGKTLLATTSANGIAVVHGSLYSGDHYIITPANSNAVGYSFSPTKIGSNKVGDQEMNTLSSCGTQLENGQSNPPCIFKVTTTGNVNTILPLPTPYPDTTVQDAEMSSLQTLGFLLVVGAGAYVVNSLIGNDSKINKR